MARNGSGTMSKAVSDFVFDTTISHTDMNNLIDDIISEITNSVDKDGQTTWTGLMQRSVTVGQTANTGSVQGGNPITTEFFEIASCGSSGDSVTLPSAVAGQLVIIVNNGANSADVFPASGDKIDGGSVNAAFALAAGANALFICQDGTDWDSLGGGFFTPSSTTTLSNKTLTSPILNDPVFDVSVGNTANTGSVQGNNPITSFFYEIAICASAGDSVTLPAASPGLMVIISNNGAESADVFPASGDKIDGGSANAAKAIASGTNTIFICQDATDWDTVSGGGGTTNNSVDTMTGDGSDTTLALSVSPGSENNVQITFDGVTQHHSTFSLSGSTITFSTAVPTGVLVEAVSGTSSTTGTPDDGTVTLAKMADNAVDETKLKDAFVADFTEVTIATGDSLLLGDVSDSGNTKKDTVQGILDLVPAAGGLYASVAIIADQKTSSTQGGGITSGAWRTRDLNTEVSDVDGIVSISSNQFTLQAGTYTIDWACTAMRTNSVSTQLYNTTDSSVTGLGFSFYVASTLDMSLPHGGSCVTTIAGAKVFEVQMQVGTTKATVGMGHRIDFTTNTYCIVKILKHA